MAVIGTNPVREKTPVDDVRLVRERLHREFGGDIRKLTEHARQVAEEYRQQLGLKVVQPPPREICQSGTME